jgi:ring-1,2-phenylacetyl-CoA epoxidase subunit PaaE
MAMTPHFHPLAIKDIRPETPDAMSIAFEVPEELRDAYRFTPGQYLTLKTEHQGEELRRSYSICSGLDDGASRGSSARPSSRGRRST